MAGLVPAIHVILAEAFSSWMPGTRPGMTTSLKSRGTIGMPL